MNIPLKIKLPEDGSKFSVDTAKPIVQHASAVEDQDQTSENSDLLRKRAINELTGSSIHLPTKVPAEGESEITTKRL